MDKILISLYVPSINQHFDVLLPSFMEINSLIPMITEALADITQYRYVPSGEEILCNSSSGILYDRNHTVEECGIRYGEKVYIF
ncbi:hypothetical protein [Frisingicoccus sp.]|uniref:hypothetical protein n=1 Tax=Frisingicoccus sp. TaxID=1918627 RepID=UPI003AB71E43